MEAEEGNHDPITCIRYEDWSITCWVGFPKLTTLVKHKAYDWSPKTAKPINDYFYNYCNTKQLCTVDL